ncbi:hypothetical protein Btru_048970 [Bulinus truncatus]|nr:hypothetical protein Btru_048970 [Bulinus truncatus]
MTDSGTVNKMDKINLVICVILLSGVCKYSSCSKSILSYNSLSPENETIKFDTDEGSGEGEFITVSDHSDRDVFLPHLVVNDSSGRPCLLATLNATMKVSYRVPEVIVHETYIAFADIQLPEDVTAHGVCSANVSSLLLDWGNSTFYVNLTFTRKPETTGENVTWSLTALSVTYDLSNTDIFKAASTKEVVTVDRQHLSLFSTQVGNTHMCDQDLSVQVGSNERGVTLTFHDVNIAAFGVTSSEYPPGTQHCSISDDSGPNEAILVPLVVASVLSVLAVSIVIAYAVTRRVTTSREQSSYKQMP